VVLNSTPEVEAVDTTSKNPNKITDVYDLIEQGDSLLEASDYVEAVDTYRDALQKDKRSKDTDNTKRADDDFFDEPDSSEMKDAITDEPVMKKSTTDEKLVTTPESDIMYSAESTSTYGKQEFSHGKRSGGTALTEINSDQICGLSMCSEKLTIAEKIKLYLESRGLD